VRQLAADARGVRHPAAEARGVRHPAAEGAGRAAPGGGGRGACGSWRRRRGACGGWRRRRGLCSGRRRLGRLGRRRLRLIFFGLGLRDHDPRRRFRVRRLNKQHQSRNDCPSEQRSRDLHYGVPCLQAITMPGCSMHSTSISRTTPRTCVSKASMPIKQLGMFRYSITSSAWASNVGETVRPWISPSKLMA
jgi:hypothetical protein